LTEYNAPSNIVVAPTIDTAIINWSSEEIDDIDEYIITLIG